MIELEKILDICSLAFGVDIKKESRKTRYVLGRACYYHYAKKLTEVSLVRMASLIDEMTHASVINGLKKYDSYRIKYFEYKMEFKAVDSGISMLIQELTPSDSQKNIIPKELKYILENYSKKELDRFINGKVLPDIMMHKHQIERIKSYGIRQQISA